MWVFIGLIPLSLLHLIRSFHRINHQHKSLAHACFILQIIYHNIYKFSLSIGKLSLTTKKTFNKLGFDYVVFKLQLEFVYLKVT